VRLAEGVVAIALAALGAVAQAAEPLVLEAKIPLGDISGRIDHLAFDSKRGRLIVAELGNNSVSVVDLDQRAVLHRITGLNTPQGVAYLAVTDTVYVASAGDGSVRRYKAGDFTETSRTSLGDDADNIRIDRTTNEVIVGYGGGGLAVLEGVAADQPASKGTRDAQAKATRGSLSRKSGAKSSGTMKGTSAVYPLPTHPEGFQIASGAQRLFVNLGSLGEVGVIDRASGKLAARWRAPGLGSNFAMALDESVQRLFVAYRRPARLAVFAIDSGTVAATLDLCADPDDIFVDARRRRLYVTCGEGAVDVLEQDSAGYRRLGRVASVRGARTGLYVPERDRLYVAAPAAAGEPAAILVFRPL
jgi:DNA-binding beta-propeller fold protein YncE